MAKAKRSWDILSDEKRRKSVDGIIEYFRSERNEDIGIIAAESVLDHFLQDIGVDLYNKGVEDAKRFIKKRFEDIEADLDAVMKTSK